MDVIKKRKKVVGLSSTMIIITAISFFIGVSINLNMFIVYGGLIIVFLTGLCFIFLPDIFNNIYNLLFKKIDKELTEDIDKLHNINNQYSGK